MKIASVWEADSTFSFLLKKSSIVTKLAMAAREATLTEFWLGANAKVMYLKLAIKKKRLRLKKRKKLARQKA